MNLPNRGFDQNSTYFEHNLKSIKIPNIFIHGVGLDHTMWLPQKKYFNNEAIIFYDLLNHGKSKKGHVKLNFNNFTQQLNQLLGYLNIAKFNLIGFSIGAIIAQHFTAKHYDKINKLILIASVYKRSKQQIIKVKNRFNMALKGESITNGTINRWFSKEYLEKNPDIYNFFFNILQKKKNEDFLPSYKMFIEADNYKLDFSNFKMPTLIMTGENDIGSTSEMSKMLQQEIKNSKLYIVPNTKHMITFEKANLVNGEIAKFIS